MNITYEQEKRACGVSVSDGVSRSKGVNGSKGVSWSEEINSSAGVSASRGINQSDGVSVSDGVSRSNGVNWSDGVRASDGVSSSFGVINSHGVDRALFLADKPRVCTIFGQEVESSRFREVKRKLCEKLNGWKPTFNNIRSLYLKHGSDWELTPINEAREISVREAWSGMPQAAVEYVKSLPEFDAEMFKRITGIEV